MAEHSTIEWTDATWNPITGCSVVSPGCTNCYAMKLAGTRLQHHPSRAGLTVATKAGPVWNGKVRLNDEWLTQPLQWKRPRVIFVCAHGDLFHEDVPDEWIDRVFAVMALCPQHTFQVLTKRSARMRVYCSNLDLPQRIKAEAHKITGGDTRVTVPLPNCWLGISAEDQTRADGRIPDLLATSAAVRFVSAEPLLGLIDFSHWTTVPANYLDYCDAVGGPAPVGVRMLDWIIVGGESGSTARPMHPAWVCGIRDQCAAAGVPFFFKQWGEWGLLHPDWPRAQPTVIAQDGTLYRLEDLAYPKGARYGEAIRAGHDKANLTSIYRVGKKIAGRLLDGIEHNGMPARAG